MTGRKSQYEGVFGDPFLDRLVEERDEAILDALWRAREPGLAVKLVQRIALVQQPRLNDLLLDEVIQPVLGEAVTKELIRVLPSSPALTGKGAARLSERLLDPAPLPGSLQASRELLEAWLVGQPARIAEQFALSVLRRQTPASPGQTVLKAAFTRAGSSERLHREASEALLQDLQETPSAAQWSVAAEFVEGTAGTLPTPELAALVKGMLVTAPTCCSTPSLPATVFALAGQSGISTINAMFDADPLPGTPGTVALAHLADGVGRSDSRRVLTSLMAVRQPATHQTVLSLADNWSDEEWRTRLSGLQKTSGLPVPFISQLLSKAPTVLARQIVELAVHAGATPELISVAVTKVSARVAEMDTAGEDAEPIEAVMPWRLSGNDDGAEALKAVLAQQTPDTRTRLVAAAIGSGAISDAIAQYISAEGDSQALLSQASIPGARLAHLTEVLLDNRPDEAAQAIRELQTDTFQIELAAGTAAYSPEIAFVGAEKAYDQLADEDRERLLNLLDEHGTWQQAQAIERFATDSNSAARPRARRAAALRLVGRLSPKGSDLPDYFGPALRVSGGAAAKAALEAIAEAQPRDIALTRTLKDIAIADGPLAPSARKALEELASGYAAALEGAAKAERLQLLPLLGAAARSTSIAPLLDHVGADSVDDDPDLHHAAAEALAEVALTQALAPDEIERLGQALEGDEPEADPQTRVQLGTAWARASLGEDAALQLLYDLIGLHPKNNPDALFHGEKDRLVRHVGLFKNNDTQGEKGWPGVLMQLDLMAERVVREAFLLHGGSEPMKATIRNDPKKPDYGALIHAFTGKLKTAQPHLVILHDLRCNKTEYTHSGSPPTKEDMGKARQAFIDGVKPLIGMLDAAARPVS